MFKILIVDDEKSIRVTLSEFLKKQNHAVDCACDANEAYGLLDTGNYDIVITDVIMPHISGIEMLAKLRERQSSVQVIVMTGEPTVATAVEAVRQGASDYLAKPITKDTLLRTVEHVLRIKSLKDEKAALEKQNLQYQKHLEEMVDERTQNLNSAMQSIVFLLSAVVEVRDPYTAGHQKRVGNLAAAIAGKMNKSPRTINLLRLIGYIHDIGKSIVPTEILVKPGKLSNLEMQLIKEHPSEGYKILCMVDLPDQVANIIKQHHERCDGSGYPCGLKEDQLLEETHIIIVADVVEAMMSHRPYRPALGIDAALAEITEKAGVLYRPDVVSTCVELFTKDHYVIDDLQHRIDFPL